jgi:hypothetical protein
MVTKISATQLARHFDPEAFAFLVAVRRCERVPMQIKLAAEIAELSEVECHQHFRAIISWYAGEPAHFIQ